MAFKVKNSKGIHSMRSLGHFPQASQSIHIGNRKGWRIYVVRLKDTDGIFYQARKGKKNPKLISGTTFEYVEQRINNP